jgi:malate/lactate dehydrogenase
LRVVIAGAGGGVGASVAFNLLVGPLDCEVVMADTRPSMLRSHLWDLQQVLELTHPPATGTVREGALSEVASADVVVLTASAPLTVNQSRMVYLADNARILSPLLDTLPGAWPGVLIVVTNPVDPLCTWTQRRTGLCRDRVLGYTLNDSLRLRTGIGKRLRMSPGRVDAWTLGEHGDAAVPLLSRVRVDGIPKSLDAREAADVLQWCKDWYVRHVELNSGRSSTWASGLGIARMVAAVAGGDELWTASVMLEGEYEIDGVSLSVPVRLGAGGVQEIVEWPLSAAEHDGLRTAARIVADAARTLA